MKIGKFVAWLAVCMSAEIAYSQPATPPAPPEPPVAPQAPVPQQDRFVEGVLMKTQRSSSDRSKYEWVCTYRVAGTTRSVLLDESCPATFRFEVRK